MWGARSDSAINYFPSRIQAFTDTQTKLNDLVSMRMKEVIDDEEFMKRKVELKNCLARIKAKLEVGEQSASEWLELAENALTFCQNAPYWFKNGSIQEKRMILTAVGSNLILNNKELTILSDEFFFAVQNAVESDGWLP